MTDSAALVPRRPRRAVWWWLVGGGVVAVVAVGVVVGLVVSLGGERLPANGCELLSSSTVGKYAPGTTCQHHSGRQVDAPAETVRDAQWVGGFGSMRISYARVEVDAGLFSDSTVASRGYAASSKTVLTQAMGPSSEWVVTDNRKVGGVGDRALILYEANSTQLYLAQVWLYVLAGKAVVEINYAASLTGGRRTGGIAMQPKEAEAGAVAMAKDVLHELD